MPKLPASARPTLCLTFDNMGSAQAVGKGETGRMGAADAEPEGYPQAIELLKRLDIKATFFIEGWNALHNPHAVRRLADHGHDIAMHGWVHEVFHTLEPVAVERVLNDSFAAFRNIGIEPSGFRAPGGKRGDHTMAILRDLDLLYDSSIDHGPGEAADRLSSGPKILEGNFPNIPWQWENIDYFHYAMHPDGERSAAQLEHHFLKRLDAIARDGGFSTFIFHAFVSCQEPERLAALENILRRAREKGIEIVTARTAATRLLRETPHTPQANRAG